MKKKSLVVAILAGLGKLATSYIVRPFPDGPALEYPYCTRKGK